MKLALHSLSFFSSAIKQSLFPPAALSGATFVVSGCVGTGHAPQPFFLTNNRSSEIQTAGRLAPVCRIGTFRPAKGGKTVSDEYIEVDGFGMTPEAFAMTPDGFAMTPDGVAMGPEHLAKPPDGFAIAPDGVAITPERLAKPSDGFAIPPEHLATTPEHLATTPDELAMAPDGVAITRDGSAKRPETPAKAGVEGAGPSWRFAKDADRVATRTDFSREASARYRPEAAKPAMLRDLPADV